MSLPLAAGGISEFASQKSRDGAGRQEAHGRRFGNMRNGCIQHQHIAVGAFHEEVEGIAAHPASRLKYLLPNNWKPQK